jgi:hypothetical protein
MHGLPDHPEPLSQHSFEEALANTEQPVTTTQRILSGIDNVLTGPEPELVPERQCCRDTGGLCSYHRGQGRTPLPRTKEGLPAARGVVLEVRSDGKPGDGVWIETHGPAVGAFGGDFRPEPGDIVEVRPAMRPEPKLPEKAIGEESKTITSEDRQARLPACYHGTEGCDMPGVHSHLDCEPKLPPCGHETKGIFDADLTCTRPMGHHGEHGDDSGAKWSAREPKLSADGLCVSCGDGSAAGACLPTYRHAESREQRHESSAAGSQTVSSTGSRVIEA